MHYRYKSGKIYGHDRGFSCAFRQWKADSHCSLLHGYALQFEFTFGSNSLDVRNWVVDFGGLKSLKGILENNFDHKLLVSEDDPQLDYISSLAGLGVADVVVLPTAGCEAFAEMVYEVGAQWLLDAGYGDRVKLLEVVVREHGANWASYSAPPEPVEDDLSGYGMRGFDLHEQEG